jgi:hypothetical protein
MTLKHKSQAIIDDLDEVAEDADKVSAEQHWPRVVLTPSNRNLTRKPRRRPYWTQHLAWPVWSARSSAGLRSTTDKGAKHAPLGNKGAPSFGELRLQLANPQMPSTNWQRHRRGQQSSWRGWSWISRPWPLLLCVKRVTPTWLQSKATG